VQFDTMFLRWDKRRTVQMLRFGEAHDVSDLVIDDDISELVEAAEAQAAKSVDWWRRVGAAMRLSDGSILEARNRHLPDETSPYNDGDPRSNFYKGVHPELSTAIHAEAGLIADAARSGKSTVDATMYVTDFPCAACAKLIAAAGIVRLYHREGYATVDGPRVLRAAGVEFHRLLPPAAQMQVDGIE
jgi:dCMP deaminase